MAATALAFTKPEDAATRDTWTEVLHEAAALERFAKRPTTAAEKSNEADSKRVEWWLSQVRPGHHGYVTREAAVGAFVTNDRGELLIKFDPQSGEWSYPLAAATGGLSPYNAARRLVLDELGVVCSPDEIRPTAAVSVDDIELPVPTTLVNFTVDIPAGSVPNTPFIRWASRDDLPPNLWNEGRWVDTAFDAIAGRIRETRFTEPRPQLTPYAGSRPVSVITPQSSTFEVADRLRQLIAEQEATANIYDKPRWQAMSRLLDRLEWALISPAASNWPDWNDGAALIKRAAEGPLSGTVDRSIDSRNRVGVKVLITAPQPERGDEDGLLMVDRAKDTQLWDPPGGHGDPYESLAGTAHGEADSESGIDITGAKLSSIIFCPDYGAPFTWIWTFGFTKRLAQRPDARIDTSEASKFGWETLSEPLPGGHSWQNVWPALALRDNDGHTASFDTVGTVFPTPSHAEIGLPWFNKRTPELLAIRDIYRSGRAPDLAQLQAAVADGAVKLAGQAKATEPAVNSAASKSASLERT